MTPSRPGPACSSSDGPSPMPTTPWPPPRHSPIPSPDVPVVGVDTGGTFTDVVDADGRVHKLLSTPDDPARAIGEGISAVGGHPSLLAHGTTVATNALLERRGARVALVATEGFAD